MALKTNFEDTNVLNSLFVDEVVNPGSERTTFSDALRAAQGKKAALPITGAPATKVVKAASPAQLRKQGASDLTVLERLRQISKAGKK